jgi:hypothetical protein
MVWSVLVSLFRSRVSLEAEILILRHQLNIQRRLQPKRQAFRAIDRLIFVGLYRSMPNSIKALTIVKPDTVIRWHLPVSDRIDAGNRGTAAADQLYRWKFAQRGQIYGARRDVDEAVGLAIVAPRSDPKAPVRPRMPNDLHVLTAGLGGHRLSLGVGRATRHVDACE